jgi:hypothetical protein
VPAARATPQASVRTAARQIVADWLTPFFKTYPEYQRGSIDSLVRDLNHWWDGVPRRATRGCGARSTRQSPEARSTSSTT